MRLAMKIKGISLQPGLSLVDWLFLGFLFTVTAGIFYAWGYDNAKREQLSELRMSGLCGASGWLEQLKEPCKEVV